MRRRGPISIRTLRSRYLGTAAAGCLVFVLFAATPAAAQKVEIRNKSRLSFDSVRLTEIVSVTGKRYAFGFTNNFRQGRSLDNVFSARVDPTTSSKIYVHTRLEGGNNDWEVKLNQKIAAFTFDVGTGSNGLFHTGVKYGTSKGKGFGLAASWVSDHVSSGSNVEVWYYFDNIDVNATVQHSRRGLRWSVNTGDKVANVIRGVLSYETGTLADGNGSAHQLVYGRNVRHGYSEFNDFDRLRAFPRENVFGDDGINIESPLFPDDDPLAWLVEGYGARIGAVDLSRKSELEAEMVKYVSEIFWFGGELAMVDGVTRAVEAKFGATAQNLKLASTFGYDPHNGSFLTSVEFRWILNK